jgi:hypothetical protein
MLPEKIGSLQRSETSLGKAVLQLPESSGCRFRLKYKIVSARKWSEIKDFVSLCNLENAPFKGSLFCLFLTDNSTGIDFICIIQLVF